MTTTPRNELDDSLNESWVELQYAQHQSQNEPLLSLGSGGPNGGSSTPYSTGSGGGGRHSQGIHFGTNMEKLLMEAQRESRSTSREGSQGGSPKGPPSPVLSSNQGSAPGSVYSNGSGEKYQGMPGLMAAAEGTTGRGENWIWDWSSRPEPLPPKEFRFKHPDKNRLSIRKTKAMRSDFFSAEILSIFIPSLLLTNLFALGMGVYIGFRIAAPRSS
ncbi:BCL2/adenovirus E1B 19 kDa protein-interacting protein 3-like [Diadema antillarum]|uniref:BCL2/adenovirus E1B 19 kDa protein-interacting protein 3-like n=1 Tax=Diadema antillarum TaxID=105358 RepID=UPI003A8C0338